MHRKQSQLWSKLSSHLHSASSIRERLKLIFKHGEDSDGRV